MGIETILIILGVIVVVALIAGRARGRRHRSPAEPVEHGHQPPRSP